MRKTHWICERAGSCLMADWQDTMKVSSSLRGRDVAKLLPIKAQASRLNVGNEQERGVVPRRDDDGLRFAQLSSQFKTFFGGYGGVTGREDHQHFIWIDRRRHREW